MVFDLNETTSSSFNFCRFFATITAPILLLLNTFNNRSSKVKKRNCCGRYFPISLFFKYGCWTPSRRWYWYLVICFSWTYFLTSLLTNSACPAFLWDGRCNFEFHADVRFIVLLTYPSDNYCVGAAHKCSKMD